ncbi:hypothetical protein B9Z55_011845 [Caenorhabditis nigoni]|uniref:Uncharacterized protein n=1 Tax=Caenorhabditis nigoni TaxID=1611254 RepID=A0A2G5ULU2_9PELO|nr:hypothetical protein B9Z55_011845 [Caenorhabditis nigoni]
MVTRIGRISIKGHRWSLGSRRIEEEQGLQAHGLAGFRGLTGIWCERGKSSRNLDQDFKDAGYKDREDLNSNVRNMERKDIVGVEDPEDSRDEFFKSKEWQDFNISHVRNMEIVGVQNPEGSMDQDFNDMDWLEATLGMWKDRVYLGSSSMVAPGPIWIFKNKICQAGAHEFQNDTSGHQDSAWTSELF